MHWIDPDCLPEVTGQLARFLPNLHGEVDGLLLSDGTEVHVPPHMAADLTAALAVGQPVRVHGVRVRHAPGFVAAVAVTGPDGRRIDDAGPPEDDADREQARHAARHARSDRTESGVIRRTVHGPKGEARGFVLDGGTVIRLPPHALAALQGRFEAGVAVAAHGPCLDTPFGTVLDAKRIGADAGSMSPIPKKPHDGKPKPHHPKPHDAKPGRRPGDPAAAA